MYISYFISQNPSVKSPDFFEANHYIKPSFCSSYAVVYLNSYSESARQKMSVYSESTI